MTTTHNLPPVLGTDWLQARAEATPGRTALLIDGEGWTFQELNLLTDQMAAYLSDLNLPKNRRVGVCMGNSLCYVLLIHAAVRLSLTLVTLNTRLTAAELAFQIDITDCRLLFADQKTAARFDPHNLQLVQLPADIRSHPPFRNASPPPIPSSFHLLTATQAIVFTSGTSGRPQPVPITFQQHVYSAMGSAKRLGLNQNDVWLSVLPLYHVGGLAVVFRSTLYGTAYDLHARFDLEAINAALDQKDISLISVVPTMLYRLIQTRQKWPSTLRLVLVGGAAATPDLVEKSNRLDPTSPREITATTYGMTEVASQFATQPPADTARKPGSVGKPFLFNQIKLINERNERATPLEYGEIWVAGPSLMGGYLNNPTANAERFDEGWFKTGDIGYLDKDGDLWIVQRRSDLIVSGGENVYPAEVEKALRAHPAVHEACVVGVPDPEWGQKVAAMIELEPGQRLTEESLMQFTVAELAGYKRPRLLRFVSQLPQTASGKVERKTVAQLMEGAAKEV
ncbi:MAG: o-succinylbenzoate--CoA ligase [Chloroflexota bacterium]